MSSTSPPPPATSVETDIVRWAASRPAWQQEVMRRVAHGHTYDAAAIARLANALIACSEQPTTPLTVQDMPRTAGSGDCVVLSSIRDLTNINALLEDQVLTFGATGLTVVYGDNGSGKSGYARLLKDAVGARDSVTIHGDAFANIQPQTQQARITFTRSGAEASAVWPAALDPALRAVGFYDEACGDAYVTRDTELTFRPGALALLDGLITVCDAVRSELEHRLNANALQQGNLPAPLTGTGAARFLAEMRSTTTNAELDAACALDADADEQLAHLIQEEARLRSTDPGRETRRLQKLARVATTLSAHVIALAATLDDAAASNIQRLRAVSRERRAAALMASAGRFDAEPVAGVGSETWRALWEAARTFSENEAYHEHRFPVVGPDARCVLCHQTLDASAASRLARFETFMRDTTARAAEDADTTFARALDSVRKVEVTSAGIATQLVELEAADGSLARQTSDWLESAEKRRTSLLQPVADGAMAILSPLRAAETAGLDSFTRSCQDSADAIDTTQFQAQLVDATARKNELEARIALAKQRGDIETEIERRVQRAKLEAAKRQVETGQISRKATELTDAHVTAMVRDWFSRESDRLNLERVVLQKTGGHKGRLRHRPSLLGASAPQPVQEILSEGEQTALGLAGFFTEAHFDSSKSALVLDDPVTSLDHIRRARVAKRLAELASDRQVVVFTHDVSFVGELRKAAGDGVALTERTVQRRGQRYPGLLTENHPWKAKDVGRRFHELEAGLARIRRESGTWDQETYENECASWAGRLSETWERLIHLEIINFVVDRDISEVNPKKFKMIARITETDDAEFQASYHRCSAWLRRHDKAPDVNYVPPEISELEQELALIRAWFKRIKSYRL